MEQVLIEFKKIDDNVTNVIQNGSIVAFITSAGVLFTNNIQQKETIQAISNHLNKEENGN